ncbi:hypothetical protein ACFFX0_01225 [Citricoccus parietis]|uniref:Uncharacterized protein n=1 Tax=Citricoccus parietis TaxID=592307 RepID=A0ABV5FT74_9MICC
MRGVAAEAVATVATTFSGDALATISCPSTSDIHTLAPRPRRWPSRPRMSHIMRR